MEEWERKFVGNEEVTIYKGRRIFKTKNGTFGFDAWMNRKGDGWWCPYTNIDGAKNAINTIEIMMKARHTPATTTTE